MNNVFDLTIEAGYLSALLIDTHHNEHLDDEAFTSTEFRDLNRVINDLDTTIVLAGEDAVELLTQRLQATGYSELDAWKIIHVVQSGEYVPAYLAFEYAKTLRHYRKRRLLLSLTDKLRDAAYEDDEDAIERLKRAVSEVERRVSDGRASVLSSEYLLTTDFPEPHWSIKDILPSGLAMIAGRPKAGKSWLALQIARDVSTGGRFLDRYSTAQTKVLYIALEDSERRLQGRMKIQEWKQTTNAKFMLSEQFHQIGGLRALAGLTEVYGVIFIDTFTRSMDGDQINPQDMKTILDPLQNVAISSNSTICFVDHMPKRVGRDNEYSVIDDVFGSVAKTGVADVVWGLYRDASTPTGVLAGTGRDLMDFKDNLVFEKGIWLMADLSARAQRSEARHTVLDCIVRSGDISQSDIVSETGMNKGSVSKAIDYLEMFGLLVSHRSGRRIIWQSSIAGRQMLEQWNETASVASQLLLAENVVNE